MTDIVERLRVWPLRRGYSEVSIRRIMRDAADEIENLRAALEEVRPLVLGANQSKDRYPKTRAVLGEKE